MVDLDGQYQYSDEVQVNVGNNVVFNLDNPIPNPANNNVSIKYSLDKESDVTINLYDMSGKLLKTLVSGSMPAGEQELNFNVNELTSGTYNIILSTDNNKAVRQIQVVK